MVKLGHTLTLLSPEKTSFMGSDMFSYYKVERTFVHERVPTTDLLYWEQIGGRLSYWIDFSSFVLVLLACRGALIREADICYTREPYLALFLPRRKTVLEMHTMPANTRLMRRLLRTVRRVAAISHGLAEDIQMQTGRSDIVVIPDAVDVTRFATLPSRAEACGTLELPADKSIVVYTGNFYPWKGVDTLAAAAAFLPETHVVVVGGTDEYDYQRILEKGRGIANLTIRRFEDASRMPVYFAAADVLVIPNAKGTAISERHTSPLKLFEYMAVGKPIVASDLPSLREVLDDDTAIFFRPDDPVSLAAAVRRALEPERASPLGVACKTRVALYSWGQRAAKALAGL
jgi:glycosyltransferase involved in cell wall biosynthesis